MYLYSTGTKFESHRFIYPTISQNHIYTNGLTKHVTLSLSLYLTDDTVGYSRKVRTLHQKTKANCCLKESCAEHEIILNSEY